MRKGEQKEIEINILTYSKKLLKEIKSYLPDGDEDTAGAAKINNFIKFIENKHKAVDDTNQEIKEKTKEKHDDWKDRYKEKLKNNRKLSKRDAAQLIAKDYEKEGKPKYSWDYIRKKL